MKVCDTHSQPEALCRECSREPDTRIPIPGSNLKMRPPKQKERKPLKKSVKKRPMKPEAMSELLADVLLRDGRCVAIDHTETMCDGQSDAAHVIPQRVLKAHYPVGHAIFKDDRNAMALCRLHHHQFDAGQLVLPAEAYPDGLEDFCTEHGFEFQGRYWMRSAA